MVIDEMNQVRPPTLVFDGDCGFCRRAVRYLMGVTAERVKFRPYQEAAQDFPAIDPVRFKESVVLMLPDGRVCYAAQAVFETMQLGGKGLLIWCYRYLPGFRRVSEAIYRWVARNRLLFSKQCELPRR